MRKVLLYLFIGTFCFTPAFGADGPARSGISNENNRVLRSSVPVRNLNGAGVSRAGSNVVSRTASNDKVRTTASRSAATTTRDVERTGVTRSVKPIQKQSAIVGRSTVKPNVTARAAKTPTVSAESIAKAKEVLEQTAQLNKSCQEQYNECMDQFCAVVDTNQKRCSCSANLSNYSKVEESVTNANAELNEVAQRIRYVGLSADEISAIMSATEAENALDGQKDTSETRSMLDDIEQLIKDPTSATTVSSTNTGFGLDLDIDFSDSGADMFSLDFLSGSNSESSISNKRGTDLYNVAKKRCATVLNECKNAGATSQQITGNYDLAIDKDCIAYEQGLNKMNETLVSNVRSANLLLQKARLAVLQNKTQYDAKGCIGALETCMTDEMVCGEDYFKCIDPTKKYIDENGNVVLGQDITKITETMSDYDVSLINSGWLENKQNDSTKSWSVADYLLTKIGTGPTIREGGLCRAVLDKCQQYSYKNDKYEPYNDIVVNYIQRAMTNIRAAQSQIISDYASSCMLDVASCYNQQVSQVNAWSSVASAQSVRAVMSGACRNVALTCAYAVFAEDKTSCPKNNDGIKNTENCLNNISEMFYQSLLCPDHSTFVGTTGDCTSLGLGCLNTQCKCEPGYFVSGSSCTACPANSTYQKDGCSTGECANTQCKCNDNYTASNGACVAKTSSGS